MLTVVWGLMCKTTELSSCTSNWKHHHTIQNRSSYSSKLYEHAGLKNIQWSGWYLRIPTLGTRRHSKELQLPEIHTNDATVYINYKDVVQRIPTSRTQGKRKRYPPITVIVAMQDTSSPAASDTPLRFNNEGRELTSSYTSDPKQQWAYWGNETSIEGHYPQTVVLNNF
jgi:hypothetical protein